jgi:hypothetical protein
VERALGGPEDLKALEARMRRDNEPKVMSASLVNYGKAIEGAKKFDSSTFANMTSRG